MTTALSITVGCGRSNPAGRVVTLDAALPPGTAFAMAMEAQPNDGERWWSPHNWIEGKRKAAAWTSSSGVGIDIDFEDGKGQDPKKWKHVAPPLEVAAALQGAALDGKLPGNCFHLTPRGARVFFLFSEMVTDRATMERAATGAGRQVDEALKAAGVPLVGVDRAGYEVDQAVLKDFARLLFAPRCTTEDGITRNSAVHVMREPGYDPRDLFTPARVMTLVTPAVIEVGDAVAKYNRENARTYPKNSGDCPVCGHRGCFGTVPDTDPPKWSCFSASHAGAGRVGESGTWVGDALDLDAWEAKCSPVELLKRKGFLKPLGPVRFPATSPGAALDGTGGDDVDNVAPIRERDYRILRSNSYGSAVFILREPALRERVLGRGVLEFNELTLSVTLNRRAVKETDCLRVRELCETELGESEEKGYKFSRSDIEDGIRQVAHERTFHPVRDYLRSLVWDGTPRIDTLPEEVLGVEGTDLKKSLIRKWLVQAVARVEQPGCDAHGVLIFHGPGGVGKSSFFKVLASRPWFGDTAMDLDDKDAYLKLHTTWIYEWAELETMARARAESAVKAFVTSADDRFRAPYDREVVAHPRRFVLGGTVNTRGILTEGRGGGNRRYWIIDTPYPIEWVKVSAMRDQVWAEAFAIYSAADGDSKAWHLTPEENSDLGAAQSAYLKRDAWEDLIRAWISTHKIERTKISAVLTGPIGKHAGQWTETDQAKAARVLSSLGWTEREVDGDFVWCSPEVLPF